MRILRLWLAMKLLGFMRPGMCLVKVLRSDGTVEWDGGWLMRGRVAVIGLYGLVNPDAPTVGDDE